MLTQRAPLGAAVARGTVRGEHSEFEREMREDVPHDALDPSPLHSRPIAAPTAQRVLEIVRPIAAGHFGHRRE